MSGGAQDDDGELGAETPRAPRRHSTSLARLESASVLINYSPLDMFEAVSEGAAFNGDARYSASLLTRARAPARVLPPHGLASSRLAAVPASVLWHLLPGRCLPP